jgi:hypothetical protein
MWAWHTQTHALPTRVYKPVSGVGWIITILKYLLKVIDIFFLVWTTNGHRSNAISMTDRFDWFFLQLMFIIFFFFSSSQSNSLSIIMSINQMLKWEHQLQQLVCFHIDIITNICKCYIVTRTKLSTMLFLKILFNQLIEKDKKCLQGCYIHISRARSFFL